MEDANYFLYSLHRRGATIWAEEGGIRFRAPKNTLAPGDVERLRAQKAEIVESLEQMDFSRDVPLRPRARGRSVPISLGEIFGAQQDVGHNLQSVRVSRSAMRVLGLLDVSLLKACLDAVVSRHESLRSTIRVVDGVLSQQIDEACTYEWEVVDVSGTSRGDKELNQLIEDFVRIEIDLSVGPLLAVRLFRLSHREHVLVLALDHAITDGTSNGILVKEIWTLYEQVEQGQPMSLPPLPVQYPDYIVWRNRTYGAWLMTHEAYWRERLTDAPWFKIPVLESSEQGLNPVALGRKIEFGSVQSARLREIARREHTVPAMVVFAVYAITMARWCNQRKLIVRLSSNGRYRSELQGMIGCLANSLFLRIEIDEGDSFLDLVRRIDLEFRAGYAHPTFHWTEGMIPDHNGDVFFNWTPGPGLQLLSKRPLCEGEEEITLLPFSLPPPLPMKFLPLFSDEQDGIHAHVTYRPDLLASSTVDQFCAYLRIFADEFGRRPLCRVESIHGAEFA